MILKSVLVSLSLFALNAFAAPDVGGCNMSFHVNIKSTFIWQSGSGTGKLTCSDATGETPYTRDVVIDIQGYGFGFGEFSYDGVSGQIGILEPEQIEGTYYVADANLALGKGLGLSLGFYNQASGLSFDGKVKAGSGIGVALNGSAWTVRLAKEAK